MTSMLLAPMQSFGAIGDAFARTLTAFAGKYWWLLTLIAIAVFLYNYYKSRLQNANQPTTTGVAATVRHIFGGLTNTAKLGLLFVTAGYTYAVYALGIFPDVFGFLAAFDPFVVGALASLAAPIWAALGNTLTVPTVGTGDGPWIGFTATLGVFALVFGTVAIADYAYYVASPSGEEMMGETQLSAWQGAIYGAGVLVVGAAIYQQTIGFSVSLDQLVAPAVAIGAVVAVSVGLYQLSDRGGIQGDE